jgi:hypothetical protein
MRWVRNGDSGAALMEVCSTGAAGQVTFHDEL